MAIIQISFYNTPTLQYSNTPRKQVYKKLGSMNLQIFNAVT
jgi:hypothetical protein